MAAYYQCPGCGAIMQDDPESAVITCKNCGSTVTKTQEIDGIVKLKAENRTAQMESRKMAMAEKEQAHEHKSRKAAWIGLAVFMVLLAAAIIVGVVLPHNNRVKELEALVIEIEQDISAGNYDVALVKTNRLRLDDDVSHEENQKWDRQREQLVELINSMRVQ